MSTHSFQLIAQEVRRVAEALEQQNEILMALIAEKELSEQEKEMAALRGYVEDTIQRVENFDRTGGEQ